jgi:glycosyltransferase involved in cell wall biosynthesis
VQHAKNRGLGAALRTGLLEARRLNARAAVYLDADLEYDPAEAQRLLDPIERGEADYVLGSRFSSPPSPLSLRGEGEDISVERSGMRLSRRIANRGFSLLLSLLCGRWISDGQTGYRAFSARAIAVAEIVHDYNYAQVLTLDLLKKGMRMTEVPVSYQVRQRGRSFISLQYLWRVPAGIARELLAD